MTLTDAVLLADASGLITIVFLVISFIVWLVNQIMEKGNGPKAQRGPQGRPAQPPPAGEDAIEAFLRRTAEARGQAAGQQPGQQPRQDAATPPPTPGPQRLERQADPYAAENATDSEDISPYESVSEHVSQYMDSDGFEQRTSHLDQVDEQLDEHIHSVFDHHVGSLASSSGEHSSFAPPPALKKRTTSAAAGLAVMLSSPQNLAGAIILQDVLRRPEI